MVRLYQKPEDSIHPPHLVCDNHGLIMLMNRIKGYPHIYPITTMDAEFDCLAQILDTVRELDALTPTFNHVKGHQDERTPGTSTSGTTQLQCGHLCKQVSPQQSRHFSPNSPPISSRGTHSAATVWHNHARP